MIEFIDLINQAITNDKMLDSQPNGNVSKTSTPEYITKFDNGIIIRFEKIK